jgi:hypothetical protein
MDLPRRLARLEHATDLRQACSEDHFAMSITRVDVDGHVPAGPDPAPCRDCGQAREPFRVLIETVPSTARDPR